MSDRTREKLPSPAVAHAWRSGRPLQQVMLTACGAEADDVFRVLGCVHGETALEAAQRLRREHARLSEENTRLLLARRTAEHALGEAWEALGEIAGALGADDAVIVDSAHAEEAAEALMVRLRPLLEARMREPAMERAWAALGEIAGALGVDQHILDATVNKPNPAEALMVHLRPLLAARGAAKKQGTR